MNAPLAPTPMSILQIQLATGKNIHVCRQNAERLALLPHIEVEFKPPFRSNWLPFERRSQHKSWMKYRAHNKR